VRGEQLLKRIISAFIILPLLCAGLFSGGALGMTALAAPVFPAGTGSLGYSEDFASDYDLSAPQEKLLLDYMHNWYASLAELKPRGVSFLFASDIESREQVENDRQLLNALCGIRAMQKTDLSLTGYVFKLTVQSMDERDGEYIVRAEEESTQRFKAYPGVGSKSYDVIHTFTLVETAAGWKLKAHRQGGSLNRLVRGLGRWQPGGTSSFTTTVSAANMSLQVRNLLASAGADVRRRNTQGRKAEPVYIREYDRGAAVAYALRYASERNEGWASYDRYGGNCQNFTSQALYAGGVPMDYAAPAQWKWFGDTPNGSNSASGRSPAWSGVNEFLEYVKDNSGFGLVAHADAPYYTGEPGDIIHLGLNDDWRHTVMITRVMKNAAGETVDYLVASNTANLRDFPASAYYYTQQMLIKIYGWNE
jgi:hypothetical protein